MNKQELDKQLALTKIGKRYLQTIAVVELDWSKEHNGYIFRPGNRRLFGYIPFSFTPSPFYTINGQQPPPILFVDRKEVVKKIVEIPMPKLPGTLF